MIRRAIALAALIGAIAVTVPMVGTPATGAPPVLAGRVHKTFTPGDGKIFVLVVGNDARSGNPDRSRADAVHVVGINTRTMKGGILNFPRDSWVNIPGSGPGRINEALYRGGPALLAKTVESITGIELDYWIMTGFQGFRGIMRELGGVEMRIPFHIHDPYGSGANLKPGKYILRSEKSLQYVRTRHSFAGGDVARTTNQAKFLLALLKKLRGQMDDNPGVLFKWLDVARRHTRFNLSADEMYRLGVLASEVSPKDVGNVTLPVSVGAVGAASVVFISPSARSIYARFRQNGSL